jgi:1-acyl-sn-glycerol-3-phosphate acyltransferase
MYALLRAAAGIALRWYYRDIRVLGANCIPRDQPLLVVVNHPNALIDALIVGWVMPRRVMITAKSTLFTNPIAASLLRWLGVLPLRRAVDEQTRGARAAVSRNAETFGAVQEALAAHRCVLIFPEGRTPNEPMLAPLKSGAARMALQASASGHVPDLAILPIGLTFERKEVPRSRVLVTIGDAIPVASWRAAHAERTPGASAVAALTKEIATRLDALTVSYPTLDDAARAFRFATLVASVIDDPPAIGNIDRHLDVETTIAREVQSIAQRLPNADPALRARVDILVARLEAVQELSLEHRVLLEDVRIDLSARAALPFVAREGWYLIAGAPVRFWGWLNHWLPIRAARVVAMRNVESAADPAMRTVVAGAVFVTTAYLVQTFAVAALLGWIPAALYLVSLPIAADVNFALRERWRRAARRARAFLLFRRDRALHTHLCDELNALRQEVIAVDRVLAALPTTAQ